MTSLAPLLRGSSLRGDVGLLTAGAGTRLGRALGTLLRRRTSSGRATLVVARSDDAGSLPVKDGIVRGLVLAGHDVKDLGAVGSDVFTFAMRHLGARAGVVITPGGDGALSLIVFMGGRPLVGEGLQALLALADGDDFSVGEGTLEVVDVTAAFRADAPFANVADKEAAS